MPTTYAIPAGDLYFNATTYSGTGAAANVANGVSGASFQPDLAWIKARNDTSWNQVFDSVRGVNKGIYTNSSYQETTQTDAFNSFNSNGMGLGADVAGGSVNKSGNTYVGCQWKAGGTAVTNTAGSITSQVSANTTSGFSIVTYTGTGVIATVGHGLGTAPAMIICKDRSTATGWLVYHQSIGNTGFVYLDQTAAANYSINGWNNTSPTSTVFTIGVNGYVNQSGQTQVSYCWAPIAGYSAFGSYNGNSTTDGPFIYLGFRPRWIMIKRINSTGDWTIWNSSMNPSNVVGTGLYADLANAESTGNSAFDFVSNGFKIRNTFANINVSGSTYIYAAFAENPFKYANAR